MRCSVCNSVLSDYETTLRHATTNQYLDTCVDCLADIAKEVPMPVKKRKDLIQSLSDINESMNVDTDEDQELYSNYRDYRDIEDN